MRPEATHKQREAELDRWYRDQLKALVAPMFTKCQAKLGAEASAWGVKRMKRSGAAAHWPAGACGSVLDWPRSRSNASSTSWRTNCCT